MHTSRPNSASSSFIKKSLSINVNVNDDNGTIVLLPEQDQDQVNSELLCKLIKGNMELVLRIYEYLAYNSLDKPMDPELIKTSLKQAHILLQNAGQALQKLANQGINDEILNLRLNSLHEQEIKMQVLLPAPPAPDVADSMAKLRI
jgi:hypothetical protein